MPISPCGHWRTIFFIKATPLPELCINKRAVADIIPALTGHGDYVGSMSGKSATDCFNAKYVMDT